MSRLDPAREQVQAGNAALTEARNAITVMRGSAYGTAKNCPIVLAQLGVVRARSAAATGAAATGAAALDARRAQIAALGEAATAVERQVLADGQAKAVIPNVQAAVSSARSEVTAETASTDNVADAIASLRLNATQILGNGNDIAGKAC